MTESSAPMTLRMLTPGGVSSDTPCDSIRLPLRDGADGRDGGFVGIWRDHAPAVMSLSPGEVRASLVGKTVMLARLEGGFASVQDNVITVITDRLVLEDSGK